MEQKMYYQNNKAYRHFISKQNRYHIGKYRNSLFSVIFIIILISSHTSASINSQKLFSNNYNNENDDDNGNANRNEHSRRHSHKYSQTLDSLLKNLKNGKTTSIDQEEPLPQPPDDINIDIDIDIDEENCPTCSLEKNTDELRLEAIKRQILSKLGLKEKPKITVPIPRDLILETLSRAGDMSSVEDDLKEKKSNSDDDLDNEPDDFYGRTREIISFADPGQPLNGQTLLEFSHSSESDPGTFISQLRVKAAVLWVRAVVNQTSLHIGKKNMTLWVFKVDPSIGNTTFLTGKSFDENTELVGSLSVPVATLGWVKIDITNAIRDWYLRSNFRKEKLRLLVDCSGCRDLAQLLIFKHNLYYTVNPFTDRLTRSTEPDRRSDRSYNRDGRSEYEYMFYEEFARQGYVYNYSSHSIVSDPNRPFLVVQTEPVVMKRSRRRALDCSGAVKGQCCKQNFFVSFKDLKWEDWIIAPKGYHANYCKGDCGGIHRTPDTYLNYHTHVMEEYRKLDKMSGIKPCCAPIKFTSMSIIYFGPENNIIKRDLPKMVVEQCGCP